MRSRLTPIGVALVLGAACIVVAIAGFAGTAMVAGENPLTVFADRSNGDRTVEVWFDNVFACSAVGTGNSLCVGAIVGSERAATIVCPNYFEPDLSRVYLATEYRLETVDGRIAPPVWMLLTHADGRPILPLHR